MQFRHGGPRPGDWDCPKCSALVFASRKVCFKCGADRPVGLQRSSDAVVDARPNPADSLPFSGLCDAFERCGATGKSAQKISIMFPDTLKKALAGHSSYPFFRLVLPQLDKERSTYGLKEKKLASTYIKCMGLNESNSDAIKLKNFKDPNSAGSAARGPSLSSSVGDLASTLEEILQHRERSKGEKATVGYVNRLLDEMCEAQDQDEREKVVNKFLADFSANQQKWLVRIIFKDMKIGLRHERVLKYLHPDAMMLYNTCTDLEKVCSKCTHSNIRLAQTVELFQQVMPMLAKRTDCEKINACMDGNAFFIEPKLDGERILCHKKGTEIRYFTRNSTEYTQNYGTGVLDPFILRCVKADECILDGEVLAWYSEEDKYVDFGANRTIAAIQRQSYDRRGRALVDSRVPSRALYEGI